MSLKQIINAEIPNVTISATGLDTSPNPINTPDGSLKEAVDVIIRRDNIVEKRRGFGLFGNSFGTNTDRAKQLMVYQNAIIRHYGTTLEFQNGVDNAGNAVFSAFSGSFTEPTAGTRIKSVEQNGNLYFTTNSGVQKISANTTDTPLSTASGFITPAGGIKAIDFQARLSTTQGDESSFFNQDSVAAYRVVWGTNDANSNLILGTPSPYIEIYNPLLSLLLLDFNTLLEILNNLNQAGSMVTFGNYVNSWKVKSTDSAQTLHTNLADVCTQIDTDLYFANATGSGVSLTIAADNTTNTISSISTNTITTTAANHNLKVGYLVRFQNSGGSLPSGITAGTNYWITTVPANNQFTISTSKGGSTLAISGGTGTNTIYFYGCLDNGSQQYIMTFSSGTPSNYISATQMMNFSGFAAQSSGTTTINGQFKITAVDSNSITFTVGSGVTGNQDTTNGQIHSYIFTTLANATATPNIPPTNTDLVALQTLIQAIITTLGEESTSVISASLVSKYLTPFTLTTSSQVILTINIPASVNSNYFFQVYRTPQVIATSTDVLANLSAGDEEQLVYEAYPTTAQLAARTITYTDNVTDTFLGTGAYLYTDQINGEGINQANDVPPLCQDINVYKNYTFYANTQTRYKQLLTLLGVSNMVSDYNGGTTPKLTIADTSGASTYSFIKGTYEVQTVACAAPGSVTDGSYFLLNGANNYDQYYVWFYKGAGTDPKNNTDCSGRTGIKVDLTVGTISTATDVGNRLRDVLSQYVNDFTVTASSGTVTITNVGIGYTDSIVDGSGSATGFTFLVTTSGQGEKVTNNTTQFTCPAESAGNYLNAGVGRYFTVNTAFDRDQYYVWFQVSGSGTDPNISGRTGVKISISSGDSGSTIATAIKTALNTLTNKFTVTTNSAVVTIANYYPGSCTATSAGTSPVTSLSTTVSGALNVLLLATSTTAPVVTPSISIDTTARSLVRVINQNYYSDVYAYYTSGPSDTPGQFYLEGKSLSTPIFYSVGNNSNTGSSFKPDLSPTYTITNTSNTITAANPAVVTVTAHGFTNGQTVVIANTNTSPNADGVYAITYISANTFSIPVNVTSAGNQVSVISTANAQAASNSVTPNRLYYSKLQQPEAVPTLNYIDVGAQNQPILRIFPLRDSLFILKQDGIYRLSGESAPFNLALFDGSQILVAPDSLGLISNLIYCWTSQGISVLSESGVSVVSKKLDNIILQTTKANYTNLPTATWGIGYQSDSAYLLYTVTNTTDTEATICYRYCALTDTWTTWNKTNTCGIINPTDDKLYLGAGNTNYIEQERKTFTRLDYTDWEYADSLNAGNYNGQSITLPSVTNYAVGDVISQSQTVTVYEFNNLLQKLDSDIGLTQKDYYSSLKAVGGNNIRTDLVNLATHLGNDASLAGSTFSTDISSLTGSISSNTAANPTVITTSTTHGLKSGRYIQITGSNCTPSIDGNYVVTVLSTTTFSIPVSVTSPGTSGSWSTNDQDFTDIKGCFNIITADLNAASGTAFKNYKTLTDTTLFEAIITNINLSTKTVTLNLNLPYLQGNLTVWKAIDSYFVFNPTTFGDPLSIKQIRESQAYFINKAFTSATLSFASDLLPAFLDIAFAGDGNGIFGFTSFGNGFFGGASNGAPFRTLLPRDVQRCRYILVKFEHSVARENFGFLGYSLTGTIGQSTRAYR